MVPKWQENYIMSLIEMFKLKNIPNFLTLIRILLIPVIILFMEIDEELYRWLSLSLYFIACIDKTDNELITLEKIHLFVEVLDRYFGNVCELDIIFNFHKAYYILDEIFIGGQLVESSKREVLRVTQAQDDIQSDETRQGNNKRGSFKGF